MTVSDAAALTGNVSISAIGAIDLQDVSSVAGKVTLENLRALPGSDITISNASSAKFVEIKSPEVNRNGQQRTAQAETIDITVAENSNIVSTSTTAKSLSLSAINDSNTEVVYDINIGGMNTLELGGSAPIFIIPQVVFKQNSSKQYKLKQCNYQHDEPEWRHQQCCK